MVTVTLTDPQATVLQALLDRQLELLALPEGTLDVAMELTPDQRDLLGEADRALRQVGGPAPPAR